MTDEDRARVSVDDHLYEPPNLWQDRVPTKYRDVAPRDRDAQAVRGAAA